MREFVISRPALWEILAEWEWHQMETWIYKNEWRELEIVNMYVKRKYFLLLISLKDK